MVATTTPDNRLLSGAKRLLGAALAVCLGLAPKPVAAESAMPGEAPHFLIESIRIDGLERAGPDLLLAESRLEAGNTYSEAELARAVDRIDRLPFILAAELTLERGSIRGAYSLVVTVREAEKWFFGAEGQLSRFDQNLVIDPPFADDRDWNATGTAGLRFYLGSSAVAFVAADDREGLKAGITHYDLFGERITATVAVSRQVCCRTQVLPLALDPSFSVYNLGDSTNRLSLGFAIPLAATQSLRLDASLLESDLGVSRSLFPGDDVVSYQGDLTQRRVALRWVFDTTDDFLLPSTGLTIAAGLEHQAFELEGVVVAPGLSAVDRRRDRLALVFDGRQVFRLTSRSTLVGSAQAALGRADDRVTRPGELIDANAFEVAAGLRHSYDLLGPQHSVAWGDLRFEVAGELGWERVSSGFAGPSPILRATLSTGVVWRNAWGVFRVGFAYSAFEMDA